jgi:hypothetical protein
MSEWLFALAPIIVIVACIREVREAVRNWLKARPVFIGPALVLAAVGAMLYIVIDPITVFFAAFIVIVAGIAAFLDPKTYSRKPPAPTE